MHFCLYVYTYLYGIATTCNTTHLSHHQPPLKHARKWGPNMDKIGMSDGAAAEFVRSTKRMVGKQRKEKERAKKQKRTDKENQRIRMETPEL